MNYLRTWAAAVRSGWKAGMRQYRKRWTELRKVAA